MKPWITAFVLSVLLQPGVHANAADHRYFGLQPPARMPQPFEPPHWLRPGRVLTNLALSPDFRHAAFSVMEVSASGKVAPAIHEARRTGGEWSEPVHAGILGTAGEGSFSPDGRWFYFSSDRPPGGPSRPRLFRSGLREGRFGAPELVVLELPDEAGAYYPRQLANGDLLFTSRGPVGGDDLFIAPARGAGFGTPRPVGGDFNSTRDDWDLIESHDGSLRFWASARDGGRGRTDIWYSRRDAGGRWSAARNLPGVSTEALETAPVLSPDDEVLFFLRRESGRERMYWVRVSTLEAP